MWWCLGWQITILRCLNNSWFPFLGVTKTSLHRWFLVGGCSCFCCCCSFETIFVLHVWRLQHSFFEEESRGILLCVLCFLVSILLWYILYKCFLSLLTWMCVCICVSASWAYCCALDEWAGIMSCLPLVSYMQTFKRSGARRHCTSKRPNVNEMTRSYWQAEHGVLLLCKENQFSLEWDGQVKWYTQSWEFTSAHLHVSSWQEMPEWLLSSMCTAVCPSFGSL